MRHLGRMLGIALFVSVVWSSSANADAAWYTCKGGRWLRHDPCRASPVGLSEHRIVDSQLLEIGIELREHVGLDL